jgi:hypothetical protein
LLFIFLFFPSLYNCCDWILNVCAFKIISSSSVLRLVFQFLVDFLL